MVSGEYSWRLHGGLIKLSFSKNLVCLMNYSLEIIVLKLKFWKLPLVLPVTSLEPYQFWNRSGLRTTNSLCTTLIMSTNMAAYLLWKSWSLLVLQYNAIWDISNSFIILHGVWAVGEQNKLLVNKFGLPGSLLQWLVRVKPFIKRSRIYCPLASSKLHPHIMIMISPCIFYMYIIAHLTPRKC